MTEKFPKPMIDALARGSAAGGHPSADLLAAFVERALGEGDAQTVAEHLAGCAQCREVVFLASMAAEEEGVPEPTGEPADVSRGEANVLPVRAAMPPKTERKSWERPGVWAGAIAAVAAAGVGVAIYLQPPEQARQVQIAAAPVQQVEQRAAEGARDAAVIRTPAKADAAKVSAVTTASPVKGSPTLHSLSAPAPSLEKRDAPSEAGAAARPSASTVEVQSTVAEAQPVPPSAALVQEEAQRTATAAPRANGFVAPKGDAVQALVGEAANGMAFQKSAISVMAAAHPGWRVTSDGRLEHRTAQGWLPVLDEKGKGFRVVTALGDEVWAGGDGGKLFHSANGGQTWTQVELGVNETGAIVAIRPESAENLAVTTSDGVTYSTSNGGKNWAKQ